MISIYDPKPFEDLLRSEIGLEISSVSWNNVESAIRTRMASLNLESADVYLARLSGSKREKDALIDEVTIPETWFFRDEIPFRYLADFVSERISSWSPQRPLRVLCAPCSTGEEPYSVVMTLLDAGLNENCFRVDAIDINHHSLEIARLAVYGNNSFRNGDLTYRLRYFKVQSDGRFQLHVHLLPLVSFTHGNILTCDFQTDSSCYDAIFCRNLLIYMESAARERTVRSIERLLKDDGLLFVGHAESLRLLEGRFRRVRVSGAFVYQKVALNAPAAVKAKDHVYRFPPLKTRAAPIAYRDIKPPATLHSIRTLSGDVPATHPDGDGLRRARLLADQGRLAEAEEMGLRYIEKNPMSADGFFLLGLVSQSRGDVRSAETRFQKAAYLDRNHREALVCLALLYEGRGDMEAARNMRGRIERIAGGGVAT